jgi:hypothetical protein
MTTCAACPHSEHNQRECGAAWDERNRCTCTEWRPGYILGLRAQALDDVQELIEAIGDRSQPTPEQWELLKELAYPPPPMANT